MTLDLLKYLQAASLMIVGSVWFLQIQHDIVKDMGANKIRVCAFGPWPALKHLNTCGYLFAPLLFSPPCFLTQVWLQAASKGLIGSGRSGFGYLSLNLSRYRYRFKGFRFGRGLRVDRRTGTKAQKRGINYIA
ncbi:hypothetical protein RHGRI_001341 [Rhododendron griersonianum]|uniref:Uncharacterized protein n=1 Tax=Rhododendron griersonianum TaxID=479676 RepID=A0AAV6LJV4_9ERIC|nr:hypothetical protein RHGRI_001341 [Rhododendron griersonianum]